MSTPTPQQIVRLGRGVEQFLENEHVQEVWEALEEIYYKEFKAADTPAQRELVHARVSALGDLRKFLEKAVQIGQDTELTLERQEQAPQS